MRHPVTKEPATALRAALGCPWPGVRREARKVLRAALQAPTLGEAAAKLGISIDSLAKLRKEHPGLAVR
jgi:hypothetical protein